MDDPRIVPALTAVVNVINACGGKGVLIGGIAVGFVAEPRATKDIDALLIAHLDSVEEVWEEARKVDFELLHLDALSQAKQSRFLRLRHIPTGVSVDLQVAIWPIDYEIVERGRAENYQGLSFRVATPEDLVILKSVAGRPQDLLDIDTIFETVPSLDKDRMRLYLLEFRELVETPETIDQIIAKYLPDDNLDQ